MAVPIEKRFAGLIRVGPKNRALIGGAHWHHPVNTIKQFV